MNLVSMKDEFLSDLVELPPSLVAQKWVIDRTPHIFQAHQHNYVLWKSKLADAIEVDGKSIVVIGSASLGFSINPHKSYRDFDKKSDIDLAVISAHHFDNAWHTIRNIGALRHKLTRPQKQSLEDHISRFIYWGTFDTKHLLPILPFGKAWLESFNKMTAEDPTKDRDINARIYRDFESLSAYHINNIKQLRENQLQGK
jgi:hypothetical protein